MLERLGRSKQLIGAPVEATWAALVGRRGRSGAKSPRQSARNSLGAPNPPGVIQLLIDPLGKAWGPSGMSWDLLGTPWRALWDHLEVLLDTLGVSWGFFRGNLELQGASLRFQRVPRRALGGILGALWRLRKGLRSNSLQYAKTFKFTVRYCKNRGPKRVNSLKIWHNLVIFFLKKCKKY